jgi:4-hydroxy-3-polyprenylbenzoate decarboxylase
VSTVTTRGRRPRIAVGITGATGAPFGVRVLQRLVAMDVETHLIMSQWGRRTIEHETPYSVAEVKAMAHVVHAVGDQAATLSSGSYRLDGMIVAPCSVRTMAAVAHGLADNLITRTADVVLKERRPLVLLVREAPFNAVHLENMLAVHRAGAVVLPPVPAFYNHPTSIDDLVDHIAGRALDQLGLEPSDLRRWHGRLYRLAQDDTIERNWSGMTQEDRAGRDDEQDTGEQQRRVQRGVRSEHTPAVGEGGDAFHDTFDPEESRPVTHHREDKPVDGG